MWNEWFTGVVVPIHYILVILQEHDLYVFLKNYIYGSLGSCRVTPAMLHVNYSVYIRSSHNYKGLLTASWFYNSFW